MIICYASFSNVSPCFLHRLQKSLLQQRLNEIESRRRALASQLVAASSLSVPMPPTSASSIASSLTTDPSSRAMDPVVMAIPERLTKSWMDAAGYIQIQPEQQRSYSPPVVVSTSKMYPAIPDGGPSVIQNDQVGCCRKSKIIFV